VYASGGHIVAGGGGGAGATGTTGTGGAGGAAGAAGSSGTGTPPGGGGSPGTDSGAGKGGTPVGTDGGNLIGGSSFGNTNGGGGGGSGVWGGGSGSPSWDSQSNSLASGSGGGGGGGSSSAPHGANAIGTATVRAGSVEIRFETNKDVTAPVITINVASPQEATDAYGRQVVYTATAIDEVDGSVQVYCTPNSGDYFPIDDTTITCEAGDYSGNYATKTASVVVQDTTAPVVTVPDPIVKEATGPNGATVDFTATATDVVSSKLTVTCTSASGSTFAIGTTSVTCSATDKAENTSSATFNVTVVDTTSPVVTLTVPPPGTTEATGPNGAAVAFTTTASDAVSGSLPTSCTAASGSTFAVGTTQVTCAATDAAGNIGSTTFDVSVVDTTKPIVTVPASIQKEAAGPTGAVVTFAATASDTVGGNLSTTCNPASGSTFGIGTTTVTCSATDAAGNTGSTTFNVTVADTTKPTLTLPTNISAPATSASGATVTYSASANDTVDGSRPVTCSKGSGTVFPVGTTTVTCTASDTRGNTATGSFTVKVEPYQADLDVTVTADRTSVIRGESVQYTVTVKNNGTSTATNVRTVLAVAGLSITGTTPITSSGSVKIQGVTYTGALWTTASIPSGGSVTFKVTGTVTAKKGDSVVAQGATASDVPDSVTTNNVATVRTPVTR
jgi:hypothetical protein